ncbi:MAG: disulfide bond formation protein DsbA [Hyphomicrobiales bacterium]|nr:MAG: disulfide bond formation protein DsbA [Hyphomicrobiales bacterium]
MAQIEFWYEFASTYSYLTAMRIEAAAEEAGVEVVWRPFLLGPIFHAQGWDSSPFNIYPEKGRYMWRDMERQCTALDLPLTRPDPFPQNGLLAARIAQIGLADGWGVAFSKSVYASEFGAGRDISDAHVLGALIEGLNLGLDAAETIERAGSAENKLALRTATEEAQERGIFGAPTFVTADGELFWGNDRLEIALHWATTYG